MPAELLIGSVTLILYVLSLPFLLRWGTGMGDGIRRQFVAIAVLHLLVLASALLRVPKVGYWPVAAIVAFGFMCALFAYGAVTKSVTLRVVHRLSRPEEPSITVSQFYHDHVEKDFSDRVRLLIESGLVEELPDGIQLTSKGRKWANQLARMQRLFGISKPGVYFAPEKNP